MSEFNKGATSAKDVILSTIIGLQNRLGNDESNLKYQAYQELCQLPTTILEKTKMDGACC